MTTTHATPSGPTTTGATTTTDVVDRFLAAIAEGRADRLGELYAPDARLDATVPGWRFAADGRQAITRTYAQWFADPGSFVELRRLTTAEGEVVVYLLDWLENGVQHQAHHAHLLTVQDGTIVADQVFCGGRWPASLLAQMKTAR